MNEIWIILGGVKIWNGVLLNSNGEYHKYESYNSINYCIEPITEEILQFEKDRREYNNIKREVSKLCDNFRKNNYSIEELKELKRILAK